MKLIYDSPLPHQISFQYNFKITLELWAQAQAHQKAQGMAYIKNHLKLKSLVMRESNLGI